jgi:phosphoribosylamine--glycine ligase
MMTIRAVAHIGKSSRLHAQIAACLKPGTALKSYAITDVYNGRLTNPEWIFVGKSDDKNFVRECIEKIKPQIAIIGPEEPLAEGIADMLAEMGVPCVGPTRSLARLETSKAFTRELLSEIGIECNPIHKVFHGLEGIEEYIGSLGEFAVKPDGLTGGKGVKVSGEHLRSVPEALAYCEELFAAGQQAIIIEEKLEGEEFSFQSFFDGKHIAHTIPVQDHKRAWDGDRGPNTGGMGSYSCEDHLLPFLTRDDMRQAEEINRRVGEALFKKTGEVYKGILYGGFMVTRNGLRVIEYNARFGDPEVMNILPIMKNNFLDVCEAIVNGTLDQLDIEFERKATVCKYIVPEGYPNSTVAGREIDVTALDAMLARETNLRAFYGAAEGDGPRFKLLGSRAIGLVGIGNTIEEAEAIAEAAARTVRGPVYHRQDIGTPELLQKRVTHMEQVRRGTHQAELKIAS